MITVVDYRLNNLRSLENTLRRGQAALNRRQVSKGLRLSKAKSWQVTGSPARRAAMSVLPSKAMTV